jgi:cytosine deaminase
MRTQSAGLTKMASPPPLGPRLTLLQNARLPGEPELVDISITAEGLVGSVLPAKAQVDDDAMSTVVDAQGALLLPALLDGHLHPDKTLLGLSPQFVDELLAADGLPAVTVQDRIAREIAARSAADAALSVEARARNMLAACAAKGTLRVRAHADVDSHIGLEQLRAVRRAADAFRGVVDVQLVAFPQSGVCGPQLGASGVPALLRDALAEFPDLVIGGLDPMTIDGALDPQLDVVLELAALVKRTLASSIRHR